MLHELLCNKFELSQEPLQKRIYSSHFTRSISHVVFCWVEMCLLMSRTVSFPNWNKVSHINAEYTKLLTLYQECGAGFTKDLESMFKDMEISRELATDFKVNAHWTMFLFYWFFTSKKSDDYPSSDDISFNVNILAQGTWPSYPTCQVILPAHVSTYWCWKLLIIHVMS